MIVKDDFTRYSWVYFLERKSDAAEAFRKFLADVRADGVPSEAEIVRSDNGGELFGGDFGYVCRQYCTKQEFINAKCPELNGIAERVLGVIKNGALAARIQAPILFPHFELYHQRPSGLRPFIGRAKPSTTPRRHLTRATSRRTRCGIVRQHQHNRTRFFVQSIAAGTARRSRSPGARVASTSGRASTTPVTHCGC